MEKPTVGREEYDREVWRRVNLEQLVGWTACVQAGMTVHEYMHSVNVQEEFQFPTEDPGPTYPKVDRNQQR